MGCAASNPNNGEDRSIVAGNMGKGAMLTSKSGQTIGFFSYHGWENKREFMSVENTVRPKINQDRVFITPKVCESSTSWLLAVYDGNGPSGHKVAQQAGAGIVQCIEGHPQQVSDKGSDVAKVLKEAFVETDRNVCKLMMASRSGTTATVVVVQDLTTLHVANVGDSHAVLGKLAGDKWVATKLTSDHSPLDPEEKARIEGAGGFVFNEEQYGAARVYDSPDPIAQMAAMGAVGGAVAIGADSVAPPWPGLAMSRCIGHTGVNSIGIIAEPSVSTYNLVDDDKVLIIASDGVWDYIDMEKACQLAMAYAPDAHSACKAIVETASQLWVEDDPTYRDDISCVVVYLPIEASLASSLAHETVEYTEDSAIALNPADLEAKVDESDTRSPFFAEGAPAPGAGATSTDDAKSELARKKALIKASKEQQKRSVVTRFG